MFLEGDRASDGWFSRPIPTENVVNLCCLMPLASLSVRMLPNADAFFFGLAPGDDLSSFPEK